MKHLKTFEGVFEDMPDRIEKSLSAIDATLRDAHANGEMPHVTDEIMSTMEVHVNKHVPTECIIDFMYYDNNDALEYRLSFEVYERQITITANYTDDYIEEYDDNITEEDLEQMYGDMILKPVTPDIIINAIDSTFAKVL